MKRSRWAATSLALVLTSITGQQPLLRMRFRYHSMAVPLQLRPNLSRRTCFLPSILTLRIRNRTSSAWVNVAIGVDAGIVCQDGPRQVAFLVDDFSVGWRADAEQQSVHHFVEPQFGGKLDGCEARLIEIHVLRARKLDGTVISQSAPEAHSMTVELKALIAEDAAKPRRKEPE